MPDEEDELLVHELRGPLTVIAGYAEILRRPRSEAERMRSIDGIERAVARADALLEDFLADRLVDGRGTETQQRVSLALVAHHAAEELGATTGRRVEVRASAEAWVLGDTARLERMLANLLANADKYSPPREPVVVRVEEREGLGVVEVVDRGAGIPEEERERLFQPFQRLARDECTPGTGLGLAVVRSIVDAHAGTVSIEDGDAGIGTRVVVQMPLAR